MLDTHITPRRVEFLRLLTRTGFASTRHLAESGLVVNATAYSQSAFFKPMLDRLLIGRMMVVSPYGIGKKVMYYITRKGAEYVAGIDGTEADSIRYLPLKGGIVKAADTGKAEGLVRADFPHKEAYVSTLIALERYLGDSEYEVADSRHYYDVRTGGTGASTGGRRFRPDGLAILRSLVPSQPQYGFVIELHRHSDRKHIVSQLRRHADAYRTGAFAGYFGKGNPYFVLSVYAAENAAVMRHVIETLKQDEKAWPYMERFFLFAELEALKSDFYKACAYFGGPKKPLPPTASRRKK